MRHKPDRLNPVEDKALDIYIEWVNQFDDFQLKREHFFSKDGQEWSETYHISDQPSRDHRLYIMAAGTGDEGGEAVLYIWGGYDDDEPYVDCILQEFDTMFSYVYNVEAGGIQIK